MQFLYEVKFSLWAYFCRLIKSTHEKISCKSEIKKSLIVPVFYQEQKIQHPVKFFSREVLCHNPLLPGLSDHALPVLNHD